MKAEVTYNAGRSYRIKGVKFEKGKTKVVTSSSVIKKCQTTVGFSVRVLDEAPEPAPKKKSKVRAVVKESAPLKKKKVKKDK